MANKFKNIVGTAFAPYVKNQFEQRKLIGKKNPRTNKEIQYLTNRNSFFRLSSSAQITSRTPPSPQTADTNDFAFLAMDDAANNLAISETDVQNANQLRIYNESFTGDLAKDNVLQGGIVISGDKNSTTLRKGFKQTYAEGTFDNLGLQPMPGITGITIGTGGKWQTLMQADIEFICYNLDQLDIMSKLYMSLGVTCFLEWGHIPYIDNNGNLNNNVTNIDFFGEDDKLNLIKSITKKRKETDGNYDAFLGTVYNFSYQADKDGAYLCKTQLMGAGGMVESLKINTSYNIDFANTTETNDAVNFNCTLDNALFAMSEFLKGTGDKKLYKTTKRTIETLFGGEGKIANNFGKVTSDMWFKNMTYKSDTYTPPKGTILNRTWGGLLNQIYNSATYSPFKFIPNNESGTIEYLNSESEFGNAHQYITDLAPEGLNKIPIDFYSGYVGQWTGGGFFEFIGSGKEQVMTYITFGHLLALVQNLGIFTESKSNTVDRKNSKPVIYIDYHPENTIINLAPVTATINPYKVLVPFRDNTSYSDFFENLDITATKKYSWSKAPDQQGLASHNLSSETVENRVNEVLPESSFLNLDPFGGKLMNVLINIDFARDSLRSTKDSDNNVNLIEFISKILSGVNECLGGVNNLRPFVDECGTVLRIIDEKAPNFEFIKEELIEIPTFGVESSAYNASYTSAITPKLASQIVIATQAAGGQGIKNFSEDVLSYQSLNANVKDRFSTFKYPAIVKPDDPTDLAKEESKYVRSLQKLYDTLWAIYTPSQKPTITKDVVTNMLSPWIDLSNQCSKKEFSNNTTNKNKNKSSVLIPLEYDITIDGIAGILPYNAFLIPNNRLPERYRGRVAFAVFSINHAFNDNNWTTTLRGQTLMLDTPRTFTKSPIIKATGNISPNPPVTNDIIGFPKVTNTGTVTEDTPGLNDSPTGGNVTNTTENTNTETIVNITTGPDGQQSATFDTVPISSNQDINAAFTFIANNETNGTPELKAYEDKDYTVSSGFTYRIGYGSDTITSTDGTVTSVTRSSRITAEQATLDLKRRIRDEFKPKVVNRLRSRGVRYDSLPLDVKVVFLDLAYNYGTLFFDFVNAWKNGGKQGVITELRRRAALGPGQVPSRRQKEINYLNG